MNPIWGVIIGAGVTALLGILGIAANRKKTTADTSSSTAAAAETIAKAANAILSPLRAELEQVQEDQKVTRADLEVTKAKLQDHIDADARGKAVRAVKNEAHQEWDELMAERLRDAGLEVPDPPPLHEEEI